MSKKKKSLSASDLSDEARQKIIEGLYAGKSLSGNNGVFTELLQQIIDGCLDVEMDMHLDEQKAQEINNRRNGRGSKKVKSQFGDLSLSPPRDRNSSFSPELVEKRSRKLGSGFDNIILALYSQGNSVEDISRLIKQMYGVDYSTSAISLVTDKVLPMVLEWQNRPLSSCYAILYLDGIYFRVKEDGRFTEKVVYSLYGVDLQGQRDVLGLYIEGSESTSNWSVVLDDIKRRGVEKLFFVCIDGLSGFRDAIKSFFPNSIVQRCIVHKVRNSIRFIPDKDRKKICADLRKIYGAVDRTQAELALEEFEIKWGQRGKRIADSWRKDWEDLMAFMVY